MKFEIKTTMFALALASLGLACDGQGGAESFDGGFSTGAGDEGGDGDGQGGDSGLDPSAGQGGAQDFGLFREILLAGGIPGPETIDDIGFFAEHKIAMPAAECGQNVCIHGMLGVMGNMISGSNCTLVLIGMNTPIDPDTLERPPLNLAIAVDLSGSMSGEPINRLRTGLLTMIPELEPDDRVSIVGFSDTAELLVSQVGPDDPTLIATIEGLSVASQTNIYDGLRTAYDEVALWAEDGRQNRVILVSDGVANVGLTQPATIQNLAASYGDAGYGLTTIGIGESFDVDLMRTLAEVGSGSFYYIDQPAALEEVFAEEVQAFVVPLAENVEIDASMFEGYDLRRVYGTKQFEVWGNDASMDIPILQIAHRVSADDNENGRRGGGGAIIMELLPTGLDPALVGEIDFRYVDPGTDELIEQKVTINSPLDPWETPVDGLFETPSVEKGFVMLNIYVGFEMAAQRASVGDYGGALTILRPLRDSVVAWVGQNDDADIADDLIYIELFLANIEAQGGTTNTPNPVPPEPWPSD